MSQVENILLTNFLVFLHTLIWQVVVVNIFQKQVDNLYTQINADEESCIQANDISTALPISQKRQNNILYPSATEKGSNRLLGESFHGGSPIKRKIHHAHFAGKIGYHQGFGDCQGENYPLNLPQNYVQDKGMNFNMIYFVFLQPFLVS